MQRLARFVLGISALALLGACASEQSLQRPLDYPYARVYAGTFDAVWNAAIQVLDLYSITKADRESGSIETDFLLFRYNTELFENPDREEFLDQIRYKVKVKLSKGMVSQTGEPAVRLQVLKELSSYGNIITDWRRVATDGLEEEVLLYRIGQRLRIQDTLKRKTVGAKQNPS